jgi:hypothetical protein
MENNMKIWDKVCVTDPEITKRVTQRGGFTAIDAQAQLKRATEVFGPYGTDWGLADLDYYMIYDGEGNMVEVTLTARFFYPGGEFPMSNDMRYRPGDECRKKLLTDLRSKCLSTLGFNSDVFEGKFDDNRYVQNLTNNKGLAEKYSRAVAALREAESIEQIDKIRTHYKEMAFDNTQMLDLEVAFKVAQERIDEREAIQQE